MAAALFLAGCDKDERYFVLFSSNTRAIVTSAPGEITPTSAVVGGRMTDISMSSVKKAGICLFKSYDLPVQEMSIISGNSERRYSNLINDGKFQVYLSDLQPGTTYCYTAFAENESVIYYGDLKILVTSLGTVKDIEGNIYQTVRIGSQIWMRENLRTRTYPDGTSINGFIESSSYAFTGTHYTWQAATGAGLKLASGMDACPDGWHVAGDSDWQELLTYTGIPASQISAFDLIGYDEASRLKDSGPEAWPYENNSNSTGFSVLPACAYSAEKEDLGPLTAFWTSTPFVYYGFPPGGRILRANDIGGSIYLSVRCIKN